MKRILPILFFLTIAQNCFATEWAWYYVYVQTEYVQGPWTRTTVFDKFENYKYLSAKPCEDLFGSESIDMVTAILGHLQKESEHPALYKFKYDLSVVADTVVIKTGGAIPDFNEIKNELIASFTLNSFAAVRFIQGGKTTMYKLEDISIPYMDLVAGAREQSVTTEKRAEVEIQQTDTATITTRPQVSRDKDQGNPLFFWLILSAIINLLLIVLLVRKKGTRLP